MLQAQRCGRDAPWRREASAAARGAASPRRCPRLRGRSEQAARESHARTHAWEPHCTGAPAIHAPLAVAQKNQAQASAPSCGAKTSPLLRREATQRGPTRVSARRENGDSAALPARAAAPTQRVAQLHAPGAHAEVEQGGVEFSLVQPCAPRVVKLQKHQAAARLQRRRVVRRRLGARRRHGARSGARALAAGARRGLPGHRATLRGGWCADERRCQGGVRKQREKPQPDAARSGRHEGALRHTPTPRLRPSLSPRRGRRLLPPAATVAPRCVACCAAAAIAARLGCRCRRSD